MVERMVLSVLAVAYISFPLVAAERSTSEQSGLTPVRGRLVTPEGTPVKGIHMTCYFRDPDRGNEYYLAGRGYMSDEDGQFRFSVRSGCLFYVSTSDTRIARFESKPVLAEGTEEMVIADLVVLPRDAVLEGRVVWADGTPGAELSYGWHSQSYRGYFPDEIHRTDSNGAFAMTDAPPDPMTFWVEVLPDTVQAWTEVPPNSKDQVFELDPNEYIELPPDWRVYGDLEAHQRQEGYRETGARLEFALPDLDGKLVLLPSGQFKGKVVLVNIFGTWCGGCLAEIPYLVRLKDQYGARGLEIVGIAFESDASATSITAVRQLARRSKINYPVLFGGQAQRKHLLSVIKGIRRFRGYPTTFFVGRDGTIGEVKIGFDTVTEARAQWHVSRMEKTIVRLLEE